MGDYKLTPRENLVELAYVGARQGAMRCKNSRRLVGERLCRKRKCPVRLW